MNNAPNLTPDEVARFVHDGLISFPETKPSGKPKRTPDEKREMKRLWARRKRAKERMGRPIVPRVVYLDRGLRPNTRDGSREHRKEYHLLWMRRHRQAQQFAA